MPGLSPGYTRSLFTGSGLSLLSSLLTVIWKCRSWRNTPSDFLEWCPDGSEYERGFCSPRVRLLTSGTPLEVRVGYQTAYASMRIVKDAWGQGPWNDSHDSIFMTAFRKLYTLSWALAYIYTTLAWQEWACITLLDPVNAQLTGSSTQTHKSYGAPVLQICANTCLLGKSLAHL